MASKQYAPSEGLCGEKKLFTEECIAVSVEGRGERMDASSLSSGHEKQDVCKKF